MRLPQVTITTHGEFAKISVIPASGSESVPCDVCCVIDISGSMGSEATLKTDTGTEGHGLSLLDIVKHSVKTIIHCLGEDDRLSIVTFSTNARTLFDLIPLDAAGKRRALRELESLRPEASTNIWDGLYHGLEVLNRGQADAPPDAARQVMLFTDGMPNVIPPRGHLPMLRRYRDSHGGSLGCSLQTFGFGYSLDSELLDELAQEGGGMYSFIPDSSFVGTVFVNSLSNLLTEISSDLKLSLETANGVTIEEVFGGYSHTNTTWGVLIQPGSLRFGQSRDMVVRLGNLSDDDPEAEYLSAHLELGLAGIEDPVRITVEGAARDEADVAVLVHYYRLRLTDLIPQVMRLAKRQQIQEACDLVQALVAEINGSGVETDEFVEAFVRDLTGQITEATSRQDWYDRWGKHYLPSLARAHRLQVCSNFKDPGLQAYGGELFDSLRDIADRTFLDLPPPTPSIVKATPTPSYSRSSGSASRYAAPAAASAPVSMSAYYSSSAPCFAGWCLVRMVNGLMKRVDELRRGDVVYSPSGSLGRIHCVIQTDSTNGRMDLVRLNGNPKSSLWITPWHPVRVGAKWCFPAHLGHVTRDVKCGAVYSFVLDSEMDTMEIEGVECIAMGHGFSKDSVVVDHPFFGSRECVLRDLKGMVGYDEMGHVRLTQGKCIRRNEETGLVCGLVQ